MAINNILSGKYFDVEDVNPKCDISTLDRPSVIKHLLANNINMLVYCGDSAMNNINDNNKEDDNNTYLREALEYYTMAALKDAHINLKICKILSPENNCEFYSLIGYDKAIGIFRTAAHSGYTRHVSASSIHILASVMKNVICKKMPFITIG